MAVLVGGALVVCLAAIRLRNGGQEASRRSVRLMAGYVWLFWLALGLPVMTGVGNLGAFGPALPAPDTTWGARFSLKLLAVVALALASLVRTAVVARVVASDRQIGSPSARGFWNMTTG